MLFNRVYDGQNKYPANSWPYNQQYSQYHWMMTPTLYCIYYMHLLVPQLNTQS